MLQHKAKLQPSSCSLAPPERPALVEEVVVAKPGHVSHFGLAIEEQQHRLEAVPRECHPAHKHLGRVSSSFQYRPHELRTPLGEQSPMCTKPFGADYQNHVAALSRLEQVSVVRLCGRLGTNNRAEGFDTRRKDRRRVGGSSGQLAETASGAPRGLFGCREHSSEGRRADVDCALEPCNLRGGLALATLFSSANIVHCGGEEGAEGALPSSSLRLLHPSIHERRGGWLVRVSRGGGKYRRHRRPGGNPGRDGLAVSNPAHHALAKAGAVQENEAVGCAAFDHVHEVTPSEARGGH
mmetsp:Transcript_27838/g.64205  ORF Transcript_27838/g.64205 Transcript_27838/m.64205 type:complete len:295 (-) Transcript_27838:2038-2922(-)